MQLAPKSSGLKLSLKPQLISALV